MNITIYPQEMTTTSQSVYMFQSMWNGFLEVKTVITKTNPHKMSCQHGKTWDGDWGWVVISPPKDRQAEVEQVHLNIFPIIISSVFSSLTFCTALDI